MYLSTLLTLGGFAQLGLAGYSLKDNYAPDNFFNMFNFDTVSYFIRSDSIYPFARSEDLSRAQSKYLGTV